MVKKNFFNIYNKFEEIFLVTVFILLVADIFLQVIMRYIFNNSLFWSEELGRFFFQWITWIGISLGAKRGQHIKITMLHEKLSSRSAEILNIISTLIVIGICVVTIYYGLYMTLFWAGSKYPCLKISLAWGYSAIPIGCTLIVLRYSGNIAASIKNIIRGSIS